MSRRTSSSARVRFFRPSLESLEERNLLSNEAFTAFLSGFSNMVDSSVESAKQLSKTVHSDTIALQAAPRNVGALVKLELDCLQLIRQASQTQELISVFGDLDMIGQSAGLITNTESSLGKGPDFETTSPTGVTTKIPTHGRTDTEVFDDDYATFQQDFSDLQSEAQAAGALMVEALSDFLSGTSSLQSLPTSAALTGAIVADSATESISPAPTEASAKGGAISESVTVNNPTDADLHVAVNYSSTDGSTASASDDCTNGSITVPLQVNPSAAGNTGTWSVAVTGEPTQTNTTNWTA